MSNFRIIQRKTSKPSETFGIVALPVNLSDCMSLLGREIAAATKYARDGRRVVYFAVQVQRNDASWIDDVIIAVKPCRL